MTDLDLKRLVEAELTWEPKINSAAGIGVRVKDGVVTLIGPVESYSEKLAAERAALRVAGVTAVANDLEIKLPGSSERSDEEIAKAAVNALEWSSSVPLDKIKVTVDKGWITLKGAVDWQFQRTAADDAVKYLRGVKGVINLVEVRPSVNKTVVKEKIEDALKRDAEVDAKRIRVETDGTKVVLKGTVHSWFERNEAERVAWEAPGVTKVENDIAVAA